MTYNPSEPVQSGTSNCTVLHVCCSGLYGPSVMEVDALKFSQTQRIMLMYVNK
jgi:hypothetical protein